MSNPFDLVILAASAPLRRQSAAVQIAASVGPHEGKCELRAVLLDPGLSRLLGGQSVAFPSVLFVLLDQLSKGPVRSLVVGAALAGQSEGRGLGQVALGHLPGGPVLFVPLLSVRGRSEGGQVHNREARAARRPDVDAQNVPRDET